MSQSPGTPSHRSSSFKATTTTTTITRKPTNNTPRIGGDAAHAPSSSSSSLSSSSSAAGPVVNLVLVGSGAVGKSSIVARLLGKDFSENYDPTVDDQYTKTFVVEDEETNALIFDTAGQQEFRSITLATIRKSHGIMLVFSVTSKDSMLELSKFRREVFSTKGGTPSIGGGGGGCGSPSGKSKTTGNIDINTLMNEVKIPMVIVGNKAEVQPHEREVSYEEGQQLAEKYKVPYIEISAKNNHHVQDAFELLIREYRKLPSLEQQLAELSKKYPAVKKQLCVLL